MQETKVKKKTGLLRNPTIEHCKICGSEFLKISSRTLTCSPECSRENRLRYQARYHEANREYIRHYEQTHRKPRPRAYCRICGELITHRELGQIRTWMHDECVYADVLETIKSGKPVQKKQYLRLQARGWTMKEFLEEYLTEE